MRVEIVARPEAAVGRSVWMARGRSDSGMSASALPEMAGLTVLDSALRYYRNGRLLPVGCSGCAFGVTREFDPSFGLSVSDVRS